MRSTSPMIFAVLQPDLRARRVRVQVQFMLTCYARKMIVSCGCMVDQGGFQTQAPCMAGAAVLIIFCISRIADHWHCYMTRLMEGVLVAFVFRLEMMPRQVLAHRVPMHVAAAVRCCSGPSVTNSGWPLVPRYDKRKLVAAQPRLGVWGLFSPPAINCRTRGHNRLCADASNRSSDFV